MRRFGLIGRPLGHSASAAYFAAKFAREGIGDALYELYELPAVGELPRLLADHPDLAGFNVTIPYKQAVIPYLDDLAFEARNIGAVNCVGRSGDRLTGYNTDLEGLRASFAGLLGDGVPERALVLGTGGASQAVQYALAELGVEYALVSRDPMKGDFTYDTLPPEEVAERLLIVNASPVGTYPAVDEAPRIPYAFVTPRHRVLDLVYNPAQTLFLAYAEQRGARTMNGETMFRVQAEASWRIWNA